MNYIYESIIILRPNITDDEIENIITKVKNIINQNGNVTEVRKEGIKPLAYKINNFEQGYYVIFFFNTDSETISELERNYRITDDIMKFITVRHDED